MEQSAYRRRYVGDFNRCECCARIDSAAEKYQRYMCVVRVPYPMVGPACRFGFETVPSGLHYDLNFSASPRIISVDDTVLYRGRKSGCPGVFLFDGAVHAFPSFYIINCCRYDILFADAERVDFFIVEEYLVVQQSAYEIAICFKLGFQMAVERSLCLFDVPSAGRDSFVCKEFEVMRGGMVGSQE